MKTTVWLVASGILMALSAPLSAQDTLRLSNGDLLHGEIKSLNKSILTMETSYSDSDFKVEWTDVVMINSPRRFTIFLSSREKILGSLRPADEPGQIDPINESFKNRFKASISSGLSIAKANNSKQFSTRATVGYSTPHWKLGASFNNTRTEQDNVEPIQRTDASLNFTYFLYKNWFVAYTYDYLSNTEQLIDFRGTQTLALGNMIVSNNRMYLSGSGGITFNREKYLNETTVLNTTEGFFGTELNAYDIGDLDVLMRFSYYPSLTQTGRHRVNFSADVKYEFPLDFFIKFGYTLNYDSKPPNDSPEQDYVFQTTLGWEF
jgi:hypothetical protein